MAPEAMAEVGEEVSCVKALLNFHLLTSAGWGGRGGYQRDAGPPSEVLGILLTVVFQSDSN